MSDKVILCYVFFCFSMLSIWFVDKGSDMLAKKIVKVMKWFKG